VVDDLASVDPWTPRLLRVHGTAELVERQGRFGPARYMRITPGISWSSNLDGRSSIEENRTSGPRRTVHRGGQ
jgi:pyridoxamine 5'-phosphate oxidase family protein